MSSNATVQLPPTEVDIRSQVGDTYYIYSSNLSLTQADIPYALPQAGQKYPLAKYKIHIQADTVTLNGNLVNRGKDFSLVARRIIVASPTVIDVSGPDPTGKDFAPGDTPQQLDTSAGATGTKGADADNGLDAGNIFVFAESIETSATASDSPLQLHAIGGRGGRGQDGHQGMQGLVGDVGPKWQDHHQDDDAPCFDVPSVGVTVDKDWMAAHIFNNSAYNSCRGGTGKTGGTGGLGGHGGTGGNGGKISCATVYSNRAAGANRPVTLKMLYDGSQYVDGGARGDSQGGSGASAFAQLASQKKLTVQLDIDDPAFQNFCNVRAESLTVALPDFAPDTGTLTLSLTHNGDSPFYTVDGGTATLKLMEFTHQPLTAGFQQNYAQKENTGICTIADESQGYANLSPFTLWTINFDQGGNEWLDLTQVQRIQLSFNGTWQIIKELVAQAQRA